MTDSVTFHGRVLELPGKHRPYVMAHRGNRAACPENTMAAFHRAIDEGADIIETDLHLSADGVFMCIHDAELDRTTSAAGPVAEKTLAELKTCSAAYGMSGYENERIPTLQELARILPPNVALALELKTDRFLEPDVGRQLAAELQATGVHNRTVLLSFSLERLQAVQAAAPDLPIGWITMKRAFPLRGVQLLGPFFPLLLANPAYVAAAHRAGQLVCPLDTAPEPRLRYYKRLKCDAVLTDDPGKTVRALARL